ncbi:alpha,alpha-trehalase TreF [Phytohalomonas tamaricis]|uniref:alpha,alpha-trehalase TreF n=1 Tax=Phytohalomonas tamaricis TaxID=2081032 RepID=UPI000D0B47B0|nr:alpha,alpha-trehalase TreF [Phytohalomonas tamaricis]
MNTETSELKTVGNQEVPPRPDLLWKDLFTDVQRRAIFDDSKTFVDLVPLASPESILSTYHHVKAEHKLDDEALKTFVLEHFAPAETAAVAYNPDPNEDVTTHIDELWTALTRQPQSKKSPYSSRIALPAAYVVPGGRFDEIYYWDSYFTMLGLLESGRSELVRDMVQNFAYLIDTFGHIPNGNRTYYLSRSQPPFFASMVDLLAGVDGDDVYRRYLPELEKEYAYWMDGADQLQPGEARRRVLRLEDGTLLNRYWDDLAEPRQEAYVEDVETAEASSRDHAMVWRNLRAGAESGWDFSSRWLKDGKTLTTIRTIDIAPIDLNSLLYHLERTLVKANELAGHTDKIDHYRERAAQRLQAIRTRFWNAEQDYYGDYLWQEDKLTGVISAAMAFPLFYGIATPEQARGVAATLERELLKPGGLSSTTTTTGQQWDQPNGWAPSQWIAIEGLKRYDNTQLARTIASRWIHTNLERYNEEHKLIEKYNVINNQRAGGGEYPAQDGFGWTNGVLRALMADYPDVH